MTILATTITYDLGNMADWVAAIATTAAVIVSLHLANRHDKPRILIAFTDQQQSSCRITNKSFRPIDLRIMLPGEESYSAFPLPPLREKIQNVPDDQPFNRDYMTFAFHPDGAGVLTARGFDIASSTKYYFIFYQRKNYWWIRQHRFFLIWQLAKAKEEMIAWNRRVFRH